MRIGEQVSQTNLELPSYLLTRRFYTKLGSYFFTTPKQVEERLRETRDLAQKYLDTTASMLVSLNKHGEIVLLNAAGYNTNSL
jgi:hypothetical protein